MDKHTIFSIFLLALVFSAGFALAYFSIKPEWHCTLCSFNGDSITPLLNKQYSPALLEQLGGAQNEIDIVMYEMKFYDTNNSVRKIEDVLIQKAKEGVKVRLILDQGEWQGQTTTLTKDNQKTAAYLKAGGVEVKFDSMKTTTHDKLIIIDSEVSIIGSHNWGFSAFERNNEASVLIKDKATAEYYKNYFDSLWEKY